MSAAVRSYKMGTVNNMTRGEVEMSDETRRYDIAIVPQNRALRLSNQGGGALVRYMAATRTAVPCDEAIAETWTEIYCKPGPSAHELFVKGEYHGERPVFEEAVIRFGTKPVTLDYGAGPGAVYCFIELRGALFDAPTGPFRQRIQEMLYVRPDVFTRPWSGELPPHLEVGEDERPKDTPKRGSGSGRAGTAVEEF